MIASTPFDSQAKPDGREPATRRQLAIRFIIVGLLLALVLGGLYAFDRFRDKAIGDFFAGMKPPPTAVAATPAEVAPFPRWIEGIGTLQARAQVNVAPEVEGRVTKLLFEAGATVEAGDPLVQLNDEPERADLATYQAQQRLAATNLERAQSLARRAVAAQSTVDENQSVLDRARAGIAHSEAMIAQKLIRAPFSGRLGIRQVELGQYVARGTTLVTLTDLDELFVNLTVPEQRRADLQTGQLVEVRVDAFPGRVFEARLTTIEPQINPETRTIRVQATLSNEEQLLLPGMFAAARVVLPSDPDVVTVPETAVIRTLYGDAVFVVHDGPAGPDGARSQSAQQTFVRTGLGHDGRIAILEGLRGGDLVVDSGQLKLQSGVAVVVKPDTALTPPTVVPRQ